MEPPESERDAPIAGRRTHSRLRVRLPARLTTLDGTSNAVLTDLSFGGAKLVINCDIAAGNEAVLAWHRFEAFGTVTWVHDGMCGLMFEELLAPRILIETRDLHDASQLPSDRELERGFAREWIVGERRRW